MHENNYKLEFNRASIETKVKTMAVEIQRWCLRVNSKHPDSLMAIPVLTGGLFFSSDLLKEIQVSLEIFPIKVTSYHNNTQRLEILNDLGCIDVRDKRILLIDDVCDTGNTLSFLSDALVTKGAYEVKTVTLIYRDGPEQKFKPDWFGFQYKGPEWFVGYGLDDCGKYRNLPAIYVIKPEDPL